MSKFKVKGYEYSNEEELHELLEIDVIDYEEYCKLQEEMKKVEKGEFVEKKRKSYKKLYLEAMERINLLMKDNQNKLKLIQKYESVLTFEQVKEIAKMRKELV